MTSVGSVICSAEKPICGIIPAFFSAASVINSSSTSEPDTSKPASLAIMAREVILVPLIPTKCIFFFFIPNKSHSQISCHHRRHDTNTNSDRTWYRYPYSHYALLVYPLLQDIAELPYEDQEN